MIQLKCDSCGMIGWAKESQIGDSHNTTECNGGAGTWQKYIKDPTPPQAVHICDVPALIDENERNKERVKQLEEQREKLSEIIRRQATHQESKFTKEEEVWARIAVAYASASNSEAPGGMGKWAARAVADFKTFFESDAQD